MSSSESFRTPAYIRCISVDGFTSSSISTWIGQARIAGSCLNTFRNFLSFLLSSGFGLAMHGSCSLHDYKSFLNATRPKKVPIEKKVMKSNRSMSS